MATTIIADINGNKSAISEDGAVHKLREYHRPFKSVEAKPVDGVRNGDLLFYFNWHSLSDKEKQECGAQAWEFDADAKKWHPLTALYTG